MPAQMECHRRERGGKARSRGDNWSKRLSKAPSGEGTHARNVAVGRGKSSVEKILIVRSISGGGRPIVEKGLLTWHMERDHGKSSGSCYEGGNPPFRVTLSEKDRLY